MRGKVTNVRRLTADDFGPLTVVAVPASAWGLAAGRFIGEVRTGRFPVLKTAEAYASREQARQAARDQHGAGVKRGDRVPGHLIDDASRDTGAHCVVCHGEGVVMMTNPNHRIPFRARCSECVGVGQAVGLVRQVRP